MKVKSEWINMHACERALVNLETLSLEYDLNMVEKGNKALLFLITTCDG